MTKNARISAPRSLRAAMRARSDGLAGVLPDFPCTAFAARKIRLAEVTCFH
ncbi:hypothetical protein ACGLHS_03975 [Variovorax sp. VaC1]|uniref:hypothetical protein n=1 Tax=Variovorax sp. VaC1 TaxID=3373132 RepID=UPI00374819FF